MVLQGTQKAERRYHEPLLFDTIDLVSEPVLALDLKGKVIAWNRQMEEMTGVKAHNILHKGDYACSIPFYGHRRPILGTLVLCPDANVEKTYSVLRKDKGGDWTAESEVVGSGGDRRLFLLRASPFRDPFGKVAGTIETVKDVTDERKLLQRLKDLEQELHAMAESLNETKIGLKVVLNQREKDKAELQGDVIDNVQRLILPYVARLRNKKMPPDHLAFLDLIEASLASIVSPFLRNATLRHRNLSPRELEIASLLKQGKNTKQVAELLTLSPRSIDFHRSNLRKKLGVGSTRDSLVSVLRSLST